MKRGFKLKFYYIYVDRRVELSTKTVPNITSFLQVLPKTFAK